MTLFASNYVDGLHEKPPYLRPYSPPIRFNLSPRQIAQAKGHLFYMHTKPCARGHSPIRLTSNGACRQCRKESLNR